MVVTKRQAYQVLVMNTLAFTVCFAAWVVNGVLVTFLVDNGVYQWNKAQMGWLIGAPVLTGALLRLPMGLLTDKYGGRLVFPLVMLVAAVPMYLLSHTDSYLQFLLASLGFGLSGATFAVGVAYTSIWFPTERQGTVLGIFGMGTMGAGITAMVAPFLLRLLTNDGADVAGWRLLPQVYAGALVVAAILFWAMTTTRTSPQVLTVAQRLAPLRNIRVWRFGLYYFVFFGGFVALSQWLVPYYLNVYSVSLAEAGLLVALFSLPGGVIRAVGGWASDKWGARTILYLVFGGSSLLLVLLFPPRVEILTPSQGVFADRAGVVTAVTEGEIVIGQDRYVLAGAPDASDTAARVRFGVHAASDEEGLVLWPTTTYSQVPVVQVGSTVGKGQVLARGETHIYFQANRWIFTGLVFLLGILMGIGSAAVYKHIPTYFPGSVGVVGGLIGVIGALGGFFNPIIFGYLLQVTGVWTTCWMLLLIVALACLAWMHVTIRRMDRAQALIREHV
ncbi:MAG: NarK/NasA family nitrate transporter [Chloroflexi bacterium]|nr:NarK/NasA family nitrate transporter [Chloroflexota bacterium]